MCENRDQKLTNGSLDSQKSKLLLVIISYVLIV